MISCKDVNNLASDYVDKTLPLKQRISFNLHLLICHHCRRFIRQMIAVIEGMPKLPETSLNETEINKLYALMDNKS